MTTRESTRQELRDLAKLAATMPKERPTPAPPVAAAPVQEGTLQRAPAPSVPSAMASIPPASATVPPVTRPRGQGLLLTSVVLGLALAVGGGISLGRTLAHRAAPLAAGASEAKALSLGTPAAPPPASAPSPAPLPPEAVTALAAATAGATAPSAVATAAVSPAAATRSVPAVTPRRMGRPAARPAGPTGPAAKDSLDEAIRKAVASP